jgi:hypothetical protein
MCRLARTGGYLVFHRHQHDMKRIQLHVPAVDAVNSLLCELMS